MAPYKNTARSTRKEYVDNDNGMSTNREKAKEEDANKRLASADNHYLCVVYCILN